MTTSHHQQSTIPIHVVVAFGAPTTGKTTLLKNLERLNDRAELGGVHFVTIHEPTNEPAIDALIKTMYNETKDQIARGESIAALVQTTIMQRRAQLYTEMLDQFASKTLPVATKAKRDAIVVVCDGHLLTDDKLYMQSKVDGGQVTAAQQVVYEAKKAELLANMHPKFARPAAFFELSIDDTSGGTHVKRIVERDSAAERDVPEQVFVVLEQYAERTRAALAEEKFAPIVHRVATDKANPRKVLTEFYQFTTDRVLKRGGELAAVAAKKVVATVEWPRQWCEEVAVEVF